MLSDALLKTKPWKLLINLFDHLSGPKSDVHRIPLLDLSKCHGLDRNSSKCHAKQELFIGGFLKHRWISHNYKRDTTSLLQGWNAFVNNVSKIGRQPWMDKVNAQCNRVLKRSPTCAFNLGTYLPIISLLPIYPRLFRLLGLRTSVSSLVSSVLQLRARNMQHSCITCDEVVLLLRWEVASWEDACSTGARILTARTMEDCGTKVAVV